MGPKGGNYLTCCFHSCCGNSQMTKDDSRSDSLRRLCQISRRIFRTVARLDARAEFGYMRFNECFLERVHPLWFDTNVPGQMP